MLLKPDLHLPIRTWVGKFKDKNGYIKVEVENHPRAFNGSIHEHVLVMEKYIGRQLPENTVVHHINRMRSDNRLENLLLLRCEDDHFSLHRAMKMGDSAIVQAFENWSRDYMALLKAGHPEKDCLSASVNAVEEQNEPQAPQIRPSFPVNTQTRDDLQKMLFQELRKLRKQLADENGVPAFIVFHDTTLIEMAKTMPTSETLMLQIRGIGQAKFDRFGGYFLAVVKKFKEEYKIAS